MHKIEKGVTATKENEDSVQVTIIQVDDSLADDYQPSFWMDYSLPEIGLQDQDQSISKLRSQYVEYKAGNYKNYDLSEMNTDQDLSQENQKFNCNSNINPQTQQYQMNVKSVYHPMSQKLANKIFKNKTRSIQYANSIYFQQSQNQKETIQDAKKQEKPIQPQSHCQYCAIM